MALCLILFLLAMAERSHAATKSPDLMTLFLSGDVMLGRGVDQILPHPGDPTLYEPYMKNARAYVEIAEEVNGPIQRPVAFSYIWGDALEEWNRRAPDLRIINLETSITRNDEPWEGKGIHYRMNPDNIPSLTVAKIDCSSLANNHVLDWGYSGLAETIETLNKAHIRTAGAGATLEDAESPAVLEVRGKGRVIVFSFGSETSGIPPSWAASVDKPGVNLLRDLSDTTVSHIRERVFHVKQRGDVVVASIHWGGNWGYEIPPVQRRFAHRLIDTAGVDVIHGHSSHHVKGIEVYKGKLILYGCGDFMNDYEGITGYGGFRGDLGLMYFVTVDPSTGRLVSLRMTPIQVKRFRVNRASPEDALWLKHTLNREGKEFGTRFGLEEDNALTIQWR